MKNTGRYELNLLIFTSLYTQDPKVIPKTNWNLFQCQFISKRMLYANELKLTSGSAWPM